MSKEILNTSKAPAPIGPYNQAVKANGFLFVSGQVAINPASNELITDNITNETNQVMKNLEAILVNAGIGFGNVVKTTIFLSDMGLFAQVNEIYAQYFTSDFPARETVAVRTLPKGVNVEISLIATTA